MFVSLGCYVLTFSLIYSCGYKAGGGMVNLNQDETRLFIT